MASTDDEGGLFDTVVADADWIASGIRRFVLRAHGGATLPAFAPGSHVPVVTPGGALRRYSLCNAPEDGDRYEIAVKREPGGRGGSVAMTDRLAVGDRLRIGAPRNEFALAPRATRFLFVAGGIGITPILSMVRHLATGARGAFRLVYLTRDASCTPFADVLAASGIAPFVTLHHDGGDPERAFDLWPLLEKPTSAHVYCCGPRPLMDAVRDMSGHWPPGAVHFESFGVDAATRARDVPFDVVLARSGRTFHVPSGRSILEVLRDAGVPVRSSCEAGSCGSCRTGLVSGDVEHRDFVLGAAEHGSQIMVCCSRARSGALVLDL
ncbi:MAG: iron-sulfur protein [Betaproteobacteria bacterium]|nr:MAG: iron-sulfur protein [Betaproteobacteria bacterium]